MGGGREGGGGAAGDPEFAVEGREAVAHAAVGETEVCGDGLVVEALSDEGKNSLLARGERGGGSGER